MEMICNLEMIRNFIRSLEATSRPRANFTAILQPISQLRNEGVKLRNGTRVPKVGFAAHFAAVKWALGCEISAQLYAVVFKWS